MIEFTSKFQIHMEVSENGGTPTAGWFIIQSSIKLNDLGVPQF